MPRFEWICSLFIIGFRGNYWFSYVDFFQCATTPHSPAVYGSFFLNSGFPDTEPDQLHLQVTLSLPFPFSGLCSQILRKAFGPCPLENVSVFPADHCWLAAGSLLGNDCTFPRGMCFSQNVCMWVGGGGGGMANGVLIKPSNKTGFKEGRGWLCATKYRDAFIDKKTLSENRLCVTACARW